MTHDRHEPGGPGLDDPDYAHFAWARFRRILKWMALVSALAGLAAVLWIAWMREGLTPGLALATFFGVALTIFMAAALMGLVFLSSGTGHDEDVERLD